MAGREIVDALREINEACACIKDAEACKDCPLKAIHTCLETSTFAEVSDDVTVKSFDDMLAYAEAVEDRWNEDDWDAYWADRKRDADADRRWELQTYGY